METERGLAIDHRNIIGASDSPSSRIVSLDLAPEALPHMSGPLKIAWLESARGELWPSPLRWVPKDSLPSVADIKRFERRVLPFYQSKESAALAPFSSCKEVLVERR